MGAGTSNHLFSTKNVSELGNFSEEERLAELERKADQERAARYVAEHVYYSMPVSLTPMATATYGRSKAYITMDDQRVEEFQQETGQLPTSPTHRKTEASDYPDSVVVDEEGDIHIDHGAFN